MAWWLGAACSALRLGALKKQWSGLTLPLRNRLATSNCHEPPELAVGAVVETVNLIRTRSDDADERQHHVHGGEKTIQ